MHSIELKFGMDITGHSQTNPIDFGECRIYTFFCCIQKEFLYITTHRVKLLRVFSYPMIHSIELKFSMHIIGHCQTNPIDFGECRMYNFIFLFKKNTKNNYYISCLLNRIVMCECSNGAFYWAQIWHVYYRSLSYILHWFWCT